MAQLTCRPAKKVRNASAQSNGSTKSTSGSSMSIKQRIALSDEQKAVLKMVVDQGKSIFFTGSAGTWPSPVNVSHDPATTRS